MEVLLEIGIEEIPARFLNPALSDIEKSIKKSLKDKRIKYRNVETKGTPRRLILVIDGLQETQEDLTETNIGPAKRVAYNEYGEPTKAALGFAKSQKIDITELKIAKTDKGEYIAATKYLKGEPTEDLLPEILKELILSLTFAKSMKWGTNKFKFVRPIKWIVAMLDEKLIEFEIEGVKSGITTFGHRFFGEKSFEVKNTVDFFAKLKRNYVIVDFEERKEMIRSLIKSKCTNEDEKVLIEENLLDEVANLVEYPYPIVGTFNAEYLEVPQEILIITMQVHQRYFPVLDQGGKLLPKFVVIRNGIEDSEFVKKGNEKVLSARLSDARFFYYEDLKISMDKFAEKLKHVVFQKDLGTIADKIDRMKVLASKMSDALLLDKNKKIDVLRCVEIAKSDLVSNMINEKEYTKLQGFMGMNYALKGEEKPSVATGIFEHYLPRYQGDSLPQTIEGIVTGVSDKMDTIVGCFSVGLIPSGSKDPYALRRAALGIVNIILNSDYDLSLFEIIQNSLNIFEEKDILKRPKDEIEKDVKEFFKQRVINVIVDKEFKKDVVESVVTADFENINDVLKRVEILQEISKEKDFSNLVLLIKRVKNITKDFKGYRVDETFLKEEAEKVLFNYFLELKENSKISILEKNYKKFFLEILKGKDFINEFFDKVMVMDKDEAIKSNRLSLLNSLDKIFNKVAIITMINE